ncbi:ferrichrome ABC transporter ATPase [Candidatus Mycoplasma haematolamae str. Purdue]|uniref:Ferrichrome ABC transporter ATPase n=1 Tax=Mycoplasma haematolamae (strain Purdue) TaxID=1212765 RepID=I7B8W8_MYCHA|nr:ABC transporter ATP-binding protein [Candidatus Mycoplasma haematolamae]AFO51690.1 ferrichrome ABC transporter ATPase [Candidatus Mycoplasma haematolamae str. Purdue]
MRHLLLSAFASASSLLGCSTYFLNSKIENDYKQLTSDGFLKEQQQESQEQSQNPNRNAWTLLYHSGAFAHLKSLMNQIDLSGSSQVATLTSSSSSSSSSESSQHSLVTDASKIYPERLKKLVNGFVKNIGWSALIQPLEQESSSTPQAQNGQSDAALKLPSFRNKFFALNSWIEIALLNVVGKAVALIGLGTLLGLLLFDKKTKKKEKILRVGYHLLTQLPGWLLIYLFKRFKKQTYLKEFSPREKIGNLFSKTAAKNDISVSGLTFFRGMNRILHPMSFGLKEKEFYSIIGPNGAGKTTLLKNIGKILNPTTGSVQLSERELSKIPNKLFWNRVAYVPQEMNIQLDTPVYDFLLYSRYVGLSRTQKATKEDHLRVLKAIKEAQIEPLRWSRMGELSGGQRQKVILASILVKDAELILMDEPTTFLDVDNRNFLISFFKKLHDSGKTIVANLHNFTEINQLSTKVIALKDGKLEKLSSKEEVLDPEFLNYLYDLNLPRERWETLLSSNTCSY